MISLQVIDSPNKDELGKYTYQFEELLIGATLNNDLILSNQENKSDRLRLVIVKEELILETLSLNQFVLLNRKKFSGRLKLKPGDLVKFGDCEFKIIEFSQYKSQDTFP